ncbi:DnaJ domain containing protein [Quillaja saponaria]|uniref:DnaJ domain containing protein n=1 Tax=Quillaja saponaria TaxID=32244 RepID=A0AAD7KQH6_QUISA|nr:DnaJ domain containing protein [Quillaja saponaria]
MAGEEDQEHEALRLKALAETKYNNSNLKAALKYAKRAQGLAPNLDGISEMVTSLKILRISSKSPTPDWYKVLQVEPFAHINIIKKQYKKLALILHPDKNPYVGSEEAFKIVGEAFRFLSDKIRRKEYDMKLRIQIQEETTVGVTEAETFWTACSTCRLLHQFEKRYVGHNLVCPSCKKSFKAVEVETNGSGEEEPTVRKRSERLRSVVSKKSTSSTGRFGDLSSKQEVGSGQKSRNASGKIEVRTGRSGSIKRNVGGDEVRKGALQNEGVSGEWGSGRLRSGGLRRRMSSFWENLERSEPKRTKTGEDTMTLAEMQFEVKKKAQQERMKSKLMDRVEDKREKKGKLDGRDKISTRSRDIEIENNSRKVKSVGLSIKEKHRSSRKSGGLEVEEYGDSDHEDLEVMAVVDSDFYDFDKDRVERSFKKGQVWAIYDDDDGMPRHYGLIDEVVSVNPFEVKISWLDLQNNGNEMICLEKMGFHVSCGRFKVSRKTSIDSLNIFSNVVDCERAAREVYRIYPKKGSVWALYNEDAIGSGGRNLPVGDKRCYNVVLFLTSYSEIHGLSMAYLEKVDGYRTIFKRQEIGCHAVRWIEKDCIQLFSHQIPARKLSDDEASELLKDCWELDPASLPSDLLTIR